MKMFKFGNTYHKLRFIEKKFKLQFFLGGLKFRKQNIRKEKRKKKQRKKKKKPQ